MSTTENDSDNVHPFLRAAQYSYIRAPRGAPRGRLHPGSRCTSRCRERGREGLERRDIAAPTYPARRACATSFQKKRRPCCACNGSQLGPFPPPELPKETNALSHDLPPHSADGPAAHAGFDRATPEPLLEAR